MSLITLAAALTAGVLFATTGCAGPESATLGSAGSTTPSGTSTAGAVVDPLTTTPPAGYVVGVTPSVPLIQRQADEVSMPWSLVAISGATLIVWFTAGDGDCYEPVGAHVDYVANAVQVALLSKDVKPTAEGCSDGLLKGRGTIKLDQPLGGRRLLHAVVSPGWAQTS